MRNRDELIRSFKDYSGQTFNMIESGSLPDVPRTSARGRSLIGWREKSASRWSLILVN